MAVTGDQARTGPSERDIDLAITALKKGTNLLKYGRRGKPKFCPFRLSNDETVLVWFSGKDEKRLKLSHVSRIISGQRTPIFQRYPRPEKEYQSLSLIYNDRSLDLICKDRDEAEVWFTGLKALISRHHRRGPTEPRGGQSSEANSPKAHTAMSSPFGSADSSQKGGSDTLHFHAPYESPNKIGLEKSLSDVMMCKMPVKGFQPSDSASVQSASSGVEGLNSQMKNANRDAFRVSLSSAFSASSHGSGHDEGDALGDVYIWGECSGDGIMGGTIYTNRGSSVAKLDSLVPKSLESVVLDVQNIACGRRHAALVTKHGEVFTWGEESGGRLGHGVDSDASNPKLVEAIKDINVDFVACGENHTCALSLSGDLFFWGGRKYGFGLPGEGNEMSHWIPKRLIGPLEGVHVSTVSCGPWHTVIVTSAGQLFTFGDGTFGALGHGNRESISKPREVESLKSLRTIRAACGVWHTAAVVEVVIGSSGSSNTSGKLFTWGDGDKGRLGHGDREARLIPTCVGTLVEPNFCQVACGHSLTVALTTNGQVYTMGSTVYGQLGNPQADGKLPARVEGKLLKKFVEEISCGAYHVAVLTSRAEVYTWGKGAHGGLGHGTTDDKNLPTLVEGLKDKQVKSVACGTNFTAAICLHKWVSGADQSMCSGCRLAFNFKRKRHNCYNCGLVFCHSCSSHKSLKASMAPDPNKLFRVCDNCLCKLSKPIDSDSTPQSTLTSRRGSMNQRLEENIVNDVNLGSLSIIPVGKLSSMESLTKVEPISSQRKKKLEFSSGRVSPFPNGASHCGTVNNSKSVIPRFGSSFKIFSASLPGSRIASRATSPTSRRCSPPRTATRNSNLAGCFSPNNALDDTTRANDDLSQEVIELKAQVEDLALKTQAQEAELERTTKQLKEAIAIAGEETVKCKAAREVIRTLTAHMKEMAERLPVGGARSSGLSLPAFAGLNHMSNVSNTAIETVGSALASIESDLDKSTHQECCKGSNRTDLSESSTTSQLGAGQIEATPRSKTRPLDVENNHGSEWVEQDETGVYITLVSLPGGLKDLKRVRFSRKRYSEKEAERWWAANRARIYQQYKIPIAAKSSLAAGKA